jgi:hypothetical protein
MMSFFTSCFVEKEKEKKEESFVPPTSFIRLWCAGTYEVNSNNIVVRFTEPVSLTCTIGLADIRKDRLSAILRVCATHYGITLSEPRKHCQGNLHERIYVATVIAKDLVDFICDRFNGPRNLDNVLLLHAYAYLRSVSSKGPGYETFITRMAYESIMGALETRTFNVVEFECKTLQNIW